VKDFDAVREQRAQEDRSFKIGGETFVRKVGVRPEVLAEYDQIGADTSATETLKIVDECILAMVENHDGSHERWSALRTREEDPVTLGDMQALVEWLIEEETERSPTQPSSPSTGGRKPTRTRSTGASS
jgi:hypothetical protein